MNRKALFAIWGGLLVALIACSPKQSGTGVGDLDSQRQAGMADSVAESVDADEVYEFPTLVKIEYPEYPPRYKDSGLSGTVNLNLKIDRWGNVRYVRVVSSDLPREFGNRAMKAAKHFKFSPMKRWGKAVHSSMCVPVQFKDRSGEKD